MVNPIVLRIFDYLWFACQLLQVFSLPDVPAINLEYTVEDLHPLPRHRPPSTPRQHVERITCPALAALYTNGDLTPNEKGIVTAAQVSHGLRITGCRSRELLDAFHQRVTLCREGLNIFQMDAAFLEHTTSTGIRDPTCWPVPNMSRFNQFISYCGANGRMYAPELNRAVTSFVQVAPGNIAGDVQDPSSPAVSILPPFALLLEVFGRRSVSDRRPYLMRNDLRRLLIEGRYPAGWTPHRYSTLQVLSTLLQVKVAGKRNTTKKT